MLTIYKGSQDCGVSWGVALVLPLDVLVMSEGGLPMRDILRVLGRGSSPSPGSGSAAHQKRKHTLYVAVAVLVAKRGSIIMTLSIS